MARFVEHLQWLSGIRDINIDYARGMVARTGKKPLELARQLAEEGFPKYALEALHLVPNARQKVHREIMALAFERWAVITDAEVSTKSDLLSKNQQEELRAKIEYAQKKSAELRGNQSDSSTL